MPDVVTRYPDVLIKELKDVGGKCGVHAPQEILKKCPAERFCSLPTGEICVYDMKNFMTMAQVTPTEWKEAIRHDPGMFGIPNLLVLIFVFGVGVVVGLRLVRKK